MSNFNKVEEILNYIQEKVIEILIDEYKFDFEKANDIFNQSTLNEIMKNKKRHRHVLHYSPGY